MDDVLVSVICTAYNQEKYIRQCLDSFIMQKTNFKFEVLINDDASTDKTADIIREYEQKYHDIIKPVYQTENQYSKGISNWKTYLFPRVKGKYVTFCEGDDYWTDPYKLQKQFDFMEANPEYTVCTHIVKRIYEPPVLPESTIPEDVYEKDYSNITYNDILLKNMFLHTSSLFFRWNVADKYECPKEVKNGDIYILTFFAKYGKIKLIPEVMSVYRCNPNGVCASLRMNMDKITAENKNCVNRLICRRAIYNNLAIDKELYFKERYFPAISHHFYFALRGKDWKTLHYLIFENAHIYLLLLKHWRVIPYLIYQDIKKLLKAFSKASNNKTK